MTNVVGDYLNSGEKMKRFNCGTGDVPFVEDDNGYWVKHSNVIAASHVRDNAIVASMEDRNTKAEIIKAFYLERDCLKSELGICEQVSLKRLTNFTFTLLILSISLAVNVAQHYGVLWTH